MVIFLPNSRLGWQLWRRKALSTRHLRQAQVEARHRQATFGETLIRLRLMDEASLADFIAERFPIPYLGAEMPATDNDAVKHVPAELMAAACALPLKKIAGTLTVAMADPTDRAVIRRLGRAAGLKIRPVLAPLSSILEIHKRLAAIESLHQQTHQGLDLSRLAPFFERLSDYRFIRVVNQGGFGIICLCRQLSLERPVAIKILNPDWNPIAQVAGRFKREGQLIALLDHPNIIHVHEQGEDSGIRYIVMEYFEGKPLDQYLRDKDWGRKLTVLIQVCGALSYAHDRGIIHRDIKPNNILVNEQGAVKLLDFGVAHYDENPSGLTTPQVVLGTPKYMAPELFKGADQTSVASDVFAFGVMAWEILTDRKFDKQNPLHPSQADRRIPRFLGDGIVQCLAADPRQRPASFTRLAAVLQQAVDQLVFGVTEEGKTTVSMRAGGNGNGQTPTPAGALKELERLYEIKSILRQDRAVRTLLAFNQNLGRDVVIKIMESPRAVERLHDYGELKEFHIGEIYGIGKNRSQVVMISEYLSGGPLPLAGPREVEPILIVEWLMGVIQALGHAEKAGLTHGHLHPGNVLLSEKGVAKVLDFGLTAGPSSPWPQYAHPQEKASGAERDRFALGILAYELIAGQAARRGMTAQACFERASASPKIHPLLKYFLGRFWAVREQYPPYADYAAMQTDLERIRNRIAEQPEWTGIPTADSPTAIR